MCRIYNPVGCLTHVKSHLKAHGINHFNSLNEVINFRNNYLGIKQQITLDHEKLIEAEKGLLTADILKLQNAIKSEKDYFESFFKSEIEEVKCKLNSLSARTGVDVFRKILNYARRRAYNRKLRDLEINFIANVEGSLSGLMGQLTDKSNRYNYITNYFKEAVAESSGPQMREVEFQHHVIEEVKNSIYGALGEYKVVKELEQLPDENTLINDFCLTFYPAIYNRQENDYIKSIQIDHLLITPAGLFLIETKNWSEKSLERLDLRSPVQQVKRTNFALFKTLATDISSGTLHLPQHHWGDRKVPIRNVIVLTNSKPNEEFQHVKVLNLNELLKYIKYFKPIFTSAETQSISDYLVNLNESKADN